MPWGKETKSGDEYVKGGKAPDEGGGLKMTSYQGEMVADVRYGTAAAGAANIAGAGHGHQGPERQRGSAGGDPPEQLDAHREPGAADERGVLKFDG